MALEISPMVDFAFKMIFGTPENASALIGLINAVLQLADPVIAVEIRNPFNRKEFEDGKLIVLDVRCQDSRGRWFNVEMQVTVHKDLLKRLVFCVSGMFVEQAKKGDEYATLRPAISICLLKNSLFRGRDQAHHRFQLVDKQSGETIEDTIEIHTVELSKYNLDEATIQQANRIEKWAFLLMCAQDYTVEQLRELLPEDEFSGAIETIKVIASKQEDRAMYDQRKRAQLDFERGLQSAREEGFDEGFQKGERKAVVATINLLRDLLGEAPTTSADFEQLTISDLTAEVEVLRQRLRSRHS